METIVIVVYIFIISALTAFAFFGKIEAKIDNILEEIKKIKNDGYE